MQVKLIAGKFIFFIKLLLESNNLTFVSLYEYFSIFNGRDVIRIVGTIEKQNLEYSR